MKKINNITGRKKSEPEIGTTQRTFLSFFSGAQGLDIGLEKSGLHCLAVNDADRMVCETVRLNRPDLTVYECDIRNLTTPKLCFDLEIAPGELFAITGGPPCHFLQQADAWACTTTEAMYFSTSCN